MRRRATFNLYVSLPDEYGAAELEVVTEKLIAFLNTGHIPVLNATWSCPEIGKKATAPGPVLAFAKEDRCEKDPL
jgi:hypothetical protein